MTAPVTAQERRWLPAAAVLVVLAAAVLRLLAVRGDLWLDELWTLGMLAELRLPLEILTRLQHDNNHLLNSLCLWSLHRRRLTSRATLASMASMGTAGFFFSIDFRDQAAIGSPG